MRLRAGETDAVLGEWGFLWCRTTLYGNRIEYRALWTLTVIPLRSVTAVEAPPFRGEVHVWSGLRQHRLQVGWFWTGTAAGVRDAIAREVRAG